MDRLVVISSPLTHQSLATGDRRVFIAQQSRPSPMAVERFRVGRFLAVFWIPLLACALRASSMSTGVAAYVLIALYALAGPRQAVVSLWLLWAFNMFNHGLCPPPGAAAFLRHVVVLAAFVSVLVYGRRFVYRATGLLIPATGLLCLFLLVHSAVLSQQVDVSLLKAVSFSMAVLAAAIGWASLLPQERKETERFVFGSLVVLTIVSLPLIRSPVGYLRNGAGFQGILVHPQNFGPTVAVLATLLAALALTNRRVRLRHAVLFASCLLCIYLSLSRIAAFALLGGLALGVASELARNVVSRARHGDRIRRPRLVFGIVAGLAVAIFAGPWLLPAVAKFVAKGSKSETVYEAAMRSRGGKLADMYENIRRHPGEGVGFGVNTDMDYYGIARDPIFRLPVMATVEKGVMPVAVIEETGFVGAMFTFPWLLVLVVRAARGGIVTSSVSWAVLVTNVAEACLFSPGGQGMFQILIAMWAATAPTRPPTFGIESNSRTSPTPVRSAA